MSEYLILGNRLGIYLVLDSEISSITKGGEKFDMATILCIAKDQVQNCTLFNAQSAKVLSDWFAKAPEINQKYGIKMLANCTVVSEHLSIMIFEAPSLDAFQRAIMEPEYFALNKIGTWEFKLALSGEETMKLFQQLQQQRTPITA